ncbi:hypothetical protein Goari_004362 [Gossypium aridum]|nr:hypothetical protein [Gossypium aridum]
MSGIIMGISQMSISLIL